MNSINTKYIADYLARLLISKSQDASTIAHLWSRLGLDNLKKPQVGQGPIRDGSQHVGIWKQEGEFYVRDQKFKDEFNLWAKVERFPKQTNKLRVLYLGESVARGYFFDPDFNPVRLIQANLERLTDNEIEVIDLAKTDLDFEGLSALFEQSLALKPDLVIFFAGNNWLPSLQKKIFSNEARSIYRKLLIADNKLNDAFAFTLSLVGNVFRFDLRFYFFRKFLKRKFRKILHDGFKNIFSLVSRNQCKVIFVIPEVNLRDWGVSDLNKVISWPRKEIKEYHKIRERLACQLDLGFKEKCKLYCRMIRLNGSSQEALYTLGKFNLDNGHYLTAYKYFRQAMDTNEFRFVNVPGITYTIQEFIRKENKTYSYSIVDLPVLFAPESLYRIPGREMFLDYCHLSSRGINVTAAAISEAILVRLGKDLRKPFPSCSSMPDATKHAEAHFLAAIHTSHWGQSDKMVNYHLEQATNFDMSIYDIMLKYCKMAFSTSARYLTKEYSELINDEMFTRYQGGLGHMKYFLDMPLASAISIHTKTTKRIRSMLYDHMVNRLDIVKTQKVNLLSSLYSKSSNLPPIRLYPIFQALDCISEFCFIIKDALNLSLSITLRVPYSPGEKLVQLLVNDTIVLSISAGNSWKSLHLLVVSDVLRPGTNRIRVKWPIDITNTDKGTQNASYAAKILKFHYKVYGEIHTFLIQKV